MSLSPFCCRLQAHTRHAYASRARETHAVPTRPAENKVDTTVQVCRFSNQKERTASKLYKTNDKVRCKLPCLILRNHTYPPTRVPRVDCIGARRSRALGTDTAENELLHSMPATMSAHGKLATTTSNRLTLVIVCHVVSDQRNERLRTRELHDRGSVLISSRKTQHPISHDHCTTHKSFE